MERAAELVRGSDGIPQARVLAADHARRAAQCVADFPVAQVRFPLCDKAQWRRQLDGCCCMLMLMRWPRPGCRRPCTPSSAGPR